MKKYSFLVLVLFFNLVSFAQNTSNADSLKQALSETKDEIKKLEAKARSIQDEIDELPGWKWGTFGTIGVNLSNFNHWYSNKNPNLSSGHINIVQSAYAKIMKEKYFWINHANLHLSWKKSYNKDKDLKNKGFEAKIDIFKVSSVFGYRLFDRFALAALADYQGAFIKDIYSPSFFDLGLGGSWKPMDDFYLVLTPLSYEVIFSDKEKNDYKSSFGAKFLANYTRSIGKINVKSSLAAFVSYQNIDFSNWVWTNSFSYTLWKKIGIGFNFGLSQNKQEVFNSKLNNYPTLKETENKLQSFWVLGLSYRL